MIRRIDVQNTRWLNTSILRPDGLEEYRERPRYGNRHAIFEQGQDLGDMHYDKHNALDFPHGTLNHISHYVEEKTGVPEKIVKGGLIVGTIASAVALSRYLGDKDEGRVS